MPGHIGIPAKRVMSMRKKNLRRQANTTLLQRIAVDKNEKRVLKRPGPDKGGHREIIEKAEEYADQRSKQSVKYYFKYTLTLLKGGLKVKWTLRT